MSLGKLFNHEAHKCYVCDTSLLHLLLKPFSPAVLTSVLTFHLVLRLRCHADRAIPLITALIKIRVKGHAADHRTSGCHLN